MLSLPRDLRLSQNDQYQAVYQEKKKRVTKSLVFYFKNNRLDYPRLGLKVSKRTVKHAVHRNRIKRINREHFRFRQEKLMGFDIVVVIRKEIKHLADKELFECLGQQWDTFLRLVVTLSSAY